MNRSKMFTSITYHDYPTNNHNNFTIRDNASQFAKYLPEK